MQQEKLENIKENVLELTEGLPKEDRKFAIDFLRKHVRLSNLQQEAIDFFNQKKVVFGSGSRNPRVVVLTKNEISQESKNRLQNAFNKMGLSDTEVFFATNNFVVTRRHQQYRDQIVIQVLKVLKPEFVVSFDNINYEDELDCEFLDTKVDADVISNKENKSAVRHLNQCFKDLSSWL